MSVSREAAWEAAGLHPGDTIAVAPSGESIGVGPVSDRANAKPCVGETKDQDGRWRPCPNVARPGPPGTLMEWMLGRTAYCAECVAELPDEDEQGADDE